MQTSGTENKYPSLTYVNKLLTAFEKSFTSQTPPPLLPKKDPSVITPLIEPLSKRELEVLALLVEGKSAGEIANLLVIAKSTVKVHIRNIYSKLDANERKVAVEKAIRWNILT
jgi:ATP/maltotriose-dependent transcriptional regulator MalT